MNKVVVTGVNIISSLGLNVEENWNNILKGTSGVRRITLFDPSEEETQVAAEVNSKRLEHLSLQHIRKRSAKQMTRVTQMGYVCAKELIEKSGIDFDQYDKSRCAVILGVVTTGNSSVEKGTTSRNMIIKGMNNALGAWIAMNYGLQGPNYSIATACSSSAYAIAQGCELIRSGRADMALVGGADSTINPEEISGFNQLYALSTENDRPKKASKPFSKDRSGFVIGEGAGLLVLESESSAKKRNAQIYAEVSGYGLMNEAYNIMTPRADGKGMAQSIEQAIQDAGIQKQDVDYINAHGTSTIQNDLYETMAIKDVFGQKAYHVPVSSIKSMLGHTIGAAGGIETIVTALSIHHNMLPPTINLDNPDPDLDLDYVANQYRRVHISKALVNSFGFGGHNATLVLNDYS